jgi:hypothetical protein
MEKAVTRFHCRPIEETECFATSKKAIRETFADVPLDFVSFGGLGRRHRWDYRVRHAPTWDGLVVADVTVSPKGTAHVSLYPMARTAYDERARGDFNGRILPFLRGWAADRLAKPCTSPDGYEEMVVVWTGTQHEMHSVRFQTGMERVCATAAPSGSESR